VTHGTQVVDFIGLHVGNNCNKIGSIAEITIVKEKLDASFMTVAVDVIDTAGVE
jgi:hypothetical protein